MKHALYLTLLVLHVAAARGSVYQQQDKQPNILLIIADDMSLHAGIYGDPAVRTPAIDDVGRDGVVFDQAFCSAPSCTASRASIITGKYPHELAEGGNLWSTLPIRFPNYTTLLAENGYTIGLTGKGWGPGNFKAGGYDVNPAGPSYESFAAFMADRPVDKPFCFWIGSHDPHRPYDGALKQEAKSDEGKVRVPAWLPDNETVRRDLLDYYAEVNRFDATVGAAVALLKSKGLYDETLIIVTSDNGMPFPRAKANVYDGGSRVPLIVRWGTRFHNGTRRNELVSLIDLAPTLLDAAGVPVPPSMTAKSLLPLLIEEKSDNRFKSVFIERERHANVRKGGLGYPVRAIRTADYLYIHNLRADRWPAGDPDIRKGLGPYGDIDNGLSKKFLVEHFGNPGLAVYTSLAMEKRPAEELYDLRKDPDQLHNVAADPDYKAIKKKLQKRLSKWRQQTNDPVEATGPDVFDDYPYYGGRSKKK